MDENKDQHVTAAPNTSDDIDVEQDGKSWRMPDPIFRQSTGRLAKGLEKKSAAESDGPHAAAPAKAVTAATDGANPATVAAPIAAPTTDIQPQPDLLEEFLAEPIDEMAPAKPQKSRAMKIIFAIAGIAAMVTIAIVFLGIVYCLFFNDSGCRDIYYYNRPNDSPVINSDS